MGRPLWQIQLITAFWPFKNILAQMVNWPIIGPWLKSAFQADRAAFIPINVDIEKPGSIPLPSPVVERLIINSPYRFILHRCLCRTLSLCENYPHNLGCLFLGRGAQEIISSLGKEASAKEALAHHHQAIAKGLVPMVGKLKWDALWLGVENARQLITICHCCHCCCYFRLYRFLPAEAKRGLQKLPGLEVHVNNNCHGCGLCARKCFMEAIKIVNGRAIIGSECRGCGRCAIFCPNRAIEIILPPLEKIASFLRPLFSPSSF